MRLVSRATEREMDKILLINKPKGISSFDVIRILRKKTGIKKIGHSGTLDPAASGLLIIGIGNATKRLKEFELLPKTYIMDVLFGLKTETGDLEGKILAKRKVYKIETKTIKNVLKKLEGKIKLQVPLYSAIKINGKPLYKYARQQIKISPPFKEMEIFYLKLLGAYKDGGYYIARIEMKCSKGTYARAVAEKIGELLGIPATLKDLVRIKIGKYSLSEAEDLNNI